MRLKVHRYAGLGALPGPCSVHHAVGKGAAKGAGEGVAVQEDVGGVKGDVVAGHVPGAGVESGFAPCVLYQIVGIAVLVDGFAVDEHHVVEGECPVVPLLLAEFLGGNNAVRKICQAGAGEVAGDVAAPGYRVAFVKSPVQCGH